MDPEMHPSTEFKSAGGFSMIPDFNDMKKSKIFNFGETENTSPGKKQSGLVNMKFLNQ